MHYCERIQYKVFIFSGKETQMEGPYISKLFLHFLSRYKVDFVSAFLLFHKHIQGLFFLSFLIMPVTNSGS